jgi:hypothetical protein
MDEILGSSASATFVRSTYEIVYMISATGMRRSQRCGFTEFKLGALLTEEHGIFQWLTFTQGRQGGNHASGALPELSG